MDKRQRILIVGCGFAGATVARELADTGDYQITVIDKRNHIGGNAYDEVCPNTGTRYHKYGPHIFHTNSLEIVNYLSRFTEWIPYQHKVMADISGIGRVPMPINLTTLNRIYNLSLGSKQDVVTFLERIREPHSSPGNAREHLESIYGKELTELFFARYTRKMWDLELEQMPVSVVARIPVRFDDSDSYFTDEYQFMPKDGYSNLFSRMLDHTDIKVELGVEFEKTMESNFDYCFNSMPIDQYFEFCFGDLPYRSIRFSHQMHAPFSFEVPTINFTHEEPVTRVTNWAMYPGTLDGESKITYETPCSYTDNNFERYYPVKTIDGKPQAIYQQYRLLASKLPRMSFIGRCGQYIYYDMHQVVANSRSIVKSFLDA